MLKAVRRQHSLSSRAVLALIAAAAMLSLFALLNAVGAGAQAGCIQPIVADAEGNVSLSGAWDYAPMSKEALRELFTAELERVFPRAKDARIERFIVVKQLAATFRPTPGADSLRPSTLTPIPNLFLAGDWVQTGWPSTMESAVRSGVQAAQAAADAS